MQEFGQKAKIIPLEIVDFLIERKSFCVESIDVELADIQRVEPTHFVFVENRRGLRKPLDIEALLKLFERKLFGVVLAAPAEKSYIVDYSFAEIAFLDKVLIACVAVALALWAGGGYTLVSPTPKRDTRGCTWA